MTPGPRSRPAPPRARPDDGELLDAIQACEFLGVSGSTLRRLLASGKLDGQVVGYYNQRFYKLTALQAYLDGHTPSGRRRPASAHTTSEDDELLDKDSARRLLGISEGTLRRRIASGELEGQVLGPDNRHRYKRAALEAYLAEQAATSTDPGPDDSSGH